MLDRASNAIADRYGGKRGLLRHLAARLQQGSRGFRALQSVNWARADRLVFVCKGNICRSPYAEARARALGLPAASFGLEAAPGKPANPDAIATAAARGLDLTGHRTVPLPAFSVHPGDVLVGMEPWHAERLKQLEGPQPLSVTLLGLWTRSPRPHLQDPYGLSRAYFDTCFRIIDACIETLAEKYRDAGHGRRD